MRDTHNVKWVMRPNTCPRCKGKLTYKSHGEYVCNICGAIERDDFGKIRNYLDKNGVSSAARIHESTGVSYEKITSFLRQGRIEIPEGSRIYIRCENCGTDIRYGRFCPACSSQLNRSVKGALDEAGAEPKYRSGKMHFINRER